MKPTAHLKISYMYCTSYHMTIFGGYLIHLTNTFKHTFSIMAVLKLSTEVIKVFRAA
jgi:hypothetical protein